MYTMFKLCEICYIINDRRKTIWEVNFTEPRLYKKGLHKKETVQKRNFPGWEEGAQLNFFFSYKNC